MKTHFSTQTKPQAGSTTMFKLKELLDLAMLPIKFRTEVSDFECRGEYCGLPVNKLWRSTAHAIRTRHHEAAISAFSHYELNGLPIEIYDLPVGCGVAHYTIEPTEIVVRGYSWNRISELFDHMDLGYVISELSWGRRQVKSSSSNTSTNDSDNARE